MTLVVTHPYVSTISESTGSGVAGGTVGPNEWNANHTLTGVASPAQGGTGITSGTGVTYFSSATVLADSGTLTANALVLGGGANGAPTTVSSLGTTSTLLHGNASGAPSFGAVNLGSEVAGTLSTGNLTAATTALFGIVKPDNTTVTISSGVLSSVGSVSGSGSANQVTFWSSSAVVTGDGSFTYAGAGTGVTVKLSSSTSTAGIAALSIVTSSSSNMASNASALNITGAWNNSATVYDAPLLVNYTNTASNSGSALFDFQLGGTSQINFQPLGYANGVGPLVSLPINSSVIRLNAAGGNGVIEVGWNNNIGMAAIGFSQVSGLVWSNGNISGSPSDISISRGAAGVLQFGGNGYNTNGWYQWSGQGRVGANVTSTTTSFANITGMTATLQAGRNYSFRAEIIATASSSGGIQLQLNTTSTSTGYTLLIDGYAIDTLVRGYSQQTAFGTSVVATTLTGTTVHGHLYGTVTTSSSMVVNFQVCQQNNSATQTIVQRGSYSFFQDMF